MKILLIILVLIALATRINTQPSVSNIVNSALLDGKTANVLLFFKSSSDIDTFLRETNTLEADIESNAEKVVQLLREEANKVQLKVVEELKLKSNQYRRYWIENVVALDNVDPALLQKLLQRKEIVRIDSNMGQYRKEDRISRKPRPTTAPLPFHITQIKANSLWKRGFKGKKVVVGVFSTGVNINHEALQTNYRGYNPNGPPQHNYNWYEGFPFVIPAPNDATNIGTHITGTIVGNKRNIGVAPEAKYIACKGVDNLGRDAPEYHLQCYQFFLAPTNVNGTNARRELRPHVVSIQYCESCTDDLLLVKPIQALLRAGIFVVSPSGQSFPGDPKCLRINRPPANIREVFTVSALSLAGSTLDTSATGPPIFNRTIQTAYAKPDAVCVGDEVVSSVFLDGINEYFGASGSSVANAVATGAAALLMSAAPHLQRRPHLLKLVLECSSTYKKSLACDTSEKRKNNEFGFGVINLERAFELAKKFRRYKDLRKACNGCRYQRRSKKSKSKKSKKSKSKKSKKSKTKKKK